MRVFPLTVALVAAAFLLPTCSGAQSLADAAAKEKERRKAAKSGRTFTEEDLRKAGASRPRETPSATAPDGAAAPAEGAGAPKDGKDGTPKPKTEDEVRADQEKAWRDRLAKANEDVTRLSGQVETMQRALNDSAQNLYGSGRAVQVSRLEDAKGQLAAAQRSVADIQEEGRRSSFR